MPADSLFDEAGYSAILDRINAVTRDTKPEWGSMNAAQMMGHCASVQEVMNGRALEGTPLLARLFKRVIRSMVLSDKPYPRNSRTHPQYVMKEPMDFDLQKNRLLTALQTFVSNGKIPGRHSLFGQMTAEERDRAAWKHLNHHLTQFGV